MSATVQQQASGGPDWLIAVDRWCQRFGDRLNPILVKETRQALKSRQFLVTFSLLLVAAFGWTVVGSLLRMPAIYTTPTAPFMLVGYYLVLAVPMLLVVPLAAYRSLEAEIDDGTLELLSISALSPWQIVLGKLASALLQMLLYFVALFPCVAFAYTLRGVDLPTVLIVMGLLFLAGLMFTIAALTFAPHSRTRTGRVMTLLVLLGLLLVGEYAVGAAAISMIVYGIPYDAELIGFTTVFGVLGVAVFGNLLITTAAMMLTPGSENRSTRLRLAMLLLTAVMIGLISFALSALPDYAVAFAIPTYTMLGLLWLVAASMNCGESPSLTPRIRRELPSSFVSRFLWTFLTPGPATGLVFGGLGLLCVIVAAYASLEYHSSQQSRSGLGPRESELIRQFLVVFVSYAVIFFVATRWSVALLRRWQPMRAEIGMAVFVVIAVFAALVPYSIGLYMNRSVSSFAYSPAQITNWAWTLSEVMNDRLPSWIAATLAAVALVWFLGSLVLSSHIALPRKTATPMRVQREQGA